MDQSILKLDATDQARLIRNREITPSQLLELTRDRVEKVNETIHAVSFVNFESARRAADKMDSFEAPFSGIPLLIKDLIDYPGMPLTYGSWLFAGNISQESTPYSSALDQAGFFVVGKTITSEFGLLGSTETNLHGVVKNPWNPEYSAGGSSGGSAAAVASGMVPLAHASDGGGSIRIPASLNGVFGFKPGKNIVKKTSNISNEYTAFVSDHCVSKSVRDSHALLAATARESGAIPPVRRNPGETMTIGYYKKTIMGETPTGEILDILENTAALCESLGHRVEEIEFPEVDGKVISDYFFSSAGKAMSDMMLYMESVGIAKSDSHAIEPFTAALIEWYRSSPKERFLAGEEILHPFIQNYISLTRKTPILLSPSLGILPPRRGYLAPHLPFDDLISRTESLAGFTPIHNMAGMPAMSVPLFSDSCGMPVGSHFSTAPGNDMALMELAYQLEEARPWKGKLDELFDRF